MSIPSSLREYFLGPALTFHHQKTIMSTLYSQLNNPRFFRLVVIVTLISFIALIVRVVRLKRQTGLLPFVMGGILIYSGFCLERSFRVGMLMEVGGSKWRDVIGVGGIRNSYVREKILYLFRRPKEDDVGKGTVNDEKESAGREKVIEPGSINEEKIVETESMSKEKMIEDKKEENKIDEKAKGSKNGKNITDEKVVTDEINGDKEDVKTNLKVKNDLQKGTNENETNDKARKDKMSDEIERSDKKGKDNHESTDAQNMKENTGTDGGTMNEEKLTIVNKTNGKGADIVKGRQNERQNVQNSGVLKNKASENVPTISNSQPGGTPMSNSQPGNATSPAETVDSDLKDGDAPQETAETQSNKKTVYNDTLEQKEFLTSLKQTMLHKENALNRIKVLLSSLKKTRKYVTEDLKLFEDNFENFLKASAEVSDVLSNADISAELYKIDMHELKKDVWERIGVVDVLEGFLRITKGPRIIPKDDLTGSTKFYFENGDHLKEIYGLNDKSSVFNASLKENVNLVPSTNSNTVISTNTDNKDNINLLPSLGLENHAANTIDTGLKDRVMNLLPSLGHRSNALVKTFGANLKQNMVNLLPGRATNNPKLNNKPFSALLNTGIRRSAMYEPLETADLSATSLSNNKFETQKNKNRKSPFDLQETQNLVKIQVFMILQGLVCLTIFIFMICNLLDIIPVFKLILLVILIGNIFIGIVSMVYAQALAKKCVLMDVPNCNKKNLFDVEEVVDILNEQQDTDKHDALSFIERKFVENYEQLSVVVVQLQKYMEGGDSKVTHKIDVFRNLINKLLFIETHFSQPNQMYVPVYAMKRFLEDLQQQLAEISYSTLFPIYRDLLECSFFFEREKGNVKSRVSNFLQLNTKRKEEKANEKCKKKIKKICKAKKDYEELAFALTTFGIVFVIMVCF